MLPQGIQPSNNCLCRGARTRTRAAVEAERRQHARGVAGGERQAVACFGGLQGEGWQRGDGRADGLRCSEKGHRVLPAKHRCCRAG